MAQIIEAIYTHGMLKPSGDLPFHEQQRVRLIVEPIETGAGDRAAAVERFRAGVERMGFRLQGVLPSRDERLR